MRVPFFDSLVLFSPFHLALFVYDIVMNRSTQVYSGIHTIFAFPQHC